MKEKILLKSEYMREALREARAAFDEGETPVGAVIVRHGEIIARAHNRVETLNDASAHAELLALKQAGERLASRRLSDCELYVTLEPCPMCMGAIVHFRVGALCFGAFDPRAGACCSLLELPRLTGCSMPYAGGMLEEECSALLSEFFRLRRELPENN